MLFFDPLYFLILLPGIILAAWAQIRVQSAYHEGKQVRSRRNLTGAQAAAAVMDGAGVTGVAIEPVQGFLSDHYDPRHKVLRLSPEVYSVRSLAALGIAAHEAGHAVQDATRYPLLVIRNALVPVAGFGSNAAWLILLAGFLMGSFELVLTGLITFSAVVLFQLVNLPVEFDASRRARAMLVNYGLVDEDEDHTVKKVLGAAALTYVAATLTAILTLVYFLIRSGVLGGRRD